MTLLVILIIIGAIVYFVFIAGDEEGTDETPSPDEETTSMWQGEPGAAVLVAAAPGAQPQIVIPGAGSTAA